MDMNYSIYQATKTQDTGWWKRASLVGFSFFLVKGLLWLVAPVVLLITR